MRRWRHCLVWCLVVVPVLLGSAAPASAASAGGVSPGPRVACGPVAPSPGKTLCSSRRVSGFRGYPTTAGESPLSSSSVGFVPATKGGAGIVKYDPDFAIGQLTSRGAKASDLSRVAKSQGWRRVQNPDGPIKYLDDSGVPRLTLKSGTARAPGSNFPHVEIRNAAGRRVDP